MTPQKTPKHSIDYTSSESEDTKPNISSKTDPSTPTTLTKNNSKSTKKDTSTPTPTASPTKKKKTNGPSGEGWSCEDRSNLFEAVVSTVEIKWEEVAAKMGPNYTGKQCREQWQRATGKKIRKALSEE